MSDEPKRPIPSEDVRVWLSDRPLMTAAMMLEHGDAPADVLAYAAAFEAWRSAHAAWRAMQRVDVEDFSGRWRMLGGPWIHEPQCFSGDVDGVRWTVSSRQAAHEIALRVSAEAFAAWASQFYELHAAEERARGALAKHVASGYDPRGRS